MARRYIKKRKLKLSRVFFVFVLLAIIGTGVYYIMKIPVRGYYISGNTYYTDEEILEKTKLNEYPSYLFTTSFVVSQRVRKDELINNIKIKKTLTGMFKVEVNENKVLFYDATKQKSILKNGQEVPYFNENSPVLVNQVGNKKVYKKFLERLDRLDSDIIKNVSEIKYDPNDIDKERFLFSMNDGNYVYLTLSKFNNISKYSEISNTISDRKGILYLDYGNYFVPKE